MTEAEREQALDAIGERIAAFLRQALESRDFERDKRVSEDIGAELLAALPRQSAAHPEWSAALAHTTRATVQMLAGHPEIWPGAFALVADYFHEIQVPRDCDHPATDRSFSTGSATEQRYTIPIDHIGRFVAVRVLGEATPVERMIFWPQVEDWDVLPLVADVLSGLALDVDESALFLAHADAFTSSDGARGPIFDKIEEWAGAHPETAKTIADRWERRDPAQISLGISSVEVLVVGVVAAHPTERVWRDALIDKLTASGSEDRWRLAAVLACFAWPKEPAPSVATRHDELKKHVQRLPERLVITGLLAMRRDADRQPGAAIETALELLKMWPEDAINEQVRVTLAVRFAGVVSRALFFMDRAKRSVGANWPRVLDILQPVTAEWCAR